MSVFNRTEEIKQWEKLLPFLGIDIRVIENETWFRARRYEVLPDLNAIYSNQITQNIMRKLEYFNHRLALNLDCCIDKEFCHKDLAEMNMSEILEISNQVMIAIHDSYINLEALLEHVSSQKISSFDIDGRATELEKKNTTPYQDWDWHGMALLEIIKTNIVKNLKIPADDIKVSMHSIGGYLFIENRAVSSIDNYQDLTRYIKMIERSS